MPAAARETRNPRSRTAHHRRWRLNTSAGAISAAASHIGQGHAKRLRQEAALVILALHRVWRFNARMPDTGIDFSAPATLRKWPSLNKQRISASLGARPYMITESILDGCIQKFMSQPESPHHLYEIQSAFV
jgi:hypothetical protein